MKEKSKYEQYKESYPNISDEEIINRIGNELQERITDTIEEVEKKAMDLLKNKWSHLFVSGYPEKPYPTNFQNDLNNVMIGILSTSVSLQNVKKAQIEILELVQSKLDGNKTEENNFWHMINKIKKELKSE
jgi:hypothetical protein